MRKVIERIVFYLFIIACWEVVSRALILPTHVLPSPRGTLIALMSGIRDGSIPRGIVMSLERLAVGYGLAIGGGIILGSAVGFSPRAENTVGSLIMGLQTLPSICWVPAALLWFGPTNAAIIFVIIMGSIFSMAISTFDGVRHIPPRYLQAARSMGSQGWHLYVDVVVPAALPAISHGLKQAWTFAWRSLMGAELLFVTAGLGSLLQIGKQRNDIALVAAVMVVITIIGLLAEGLIFSQVESWIRNRWGLSKD